jgi:feruloyl esterase
MTFASPMKCMVVSVALLLACSPAPTASMDSSTTALEKQRDSASAEKGRDHGGQTCESLAGLQLTDTTIVSATSITPPFVSPVNGLGGTTTVTVPFCRVVGVETPSSDSDIIFELWLPPASGWNHKLLASGDLGFSGASNYPGMLTALTRGFAALGNDLGHQTNAFTATWALGHPQKVIDYGYRADHVVVIAAKQIVRAFYGHGPSRSYFTACSHGGGNALSEAQRYPDDFDGIIAGAFGNWWTNVQAAYVWEALAALNDPASGIPAAKLTMITAAAVAACDANDGVVDGLISEPRKCSFDPHTLLCAGADAPTCLTAAQIVAVEKIYAGPTNPRTGAQIFPGLERGSEFGWETLIAGPQPFLGGEFFRYFVFADPTFDFHNLDFDKDVTFANETVGQVVNALNPDLKPFAERGGKLIMYQGWADPLINPRGAINYYDSVVAAEKHRHGESRHGNEALRRTQEFTRLFLAPGMGHCAGGPGPNTFGETNFAGQPASPELDAEHDLISALDRWVEDDRAPDSVIATKFVNDDPTQGIAMQRPLCPYPQVARWTGRGSTNDAANFRCVPKEHDRDGDGR